MHEPMDEEPDLLEPNSVAGQPPHNHHPTNQRYINVRPRRPRIFRYKYEWQLHPRRAPWLRRHAETDTRAMCIICNKSFGAKLDIINNHERSQRHRENMARFNRDDDNIEVDGDALDRFHEEVARIKIMLCIFFAKHHLPFVLIDEMLDFIVHIAGNFEALRSVKMKRTTLTKITKHAVAAVHKNYLTTMLRKKKFSILFDESTDISNGKHGVVVVRFYNDHLKKIMSALWELIPNYDDDDEASDATVATITDRIMRSFNYFHDIPQSNVVAFSSDGANVMVGKHNSVAQRFRLNFPNIFKVVCPCHGAHLCASYGYRILPQHIQDFPRDTHNTFKSSKRQHALKQQQIDNYKDINKILRPVPVRWLVMGPVVKRIVEQWDPITNVVNNLDGNSDFVLRMKEAVRNPETICYMHFLNHVLPKLEGLNGVLQRESCMLPQIYLKIDICLKSIAECFIKEQYLLNIDYETMNFADPTKHKHGIDIGEQTVEAAQNLSPVERQNFISICTRYYIELVNQICERLERIWRPYKQVDFFLPSRAISRFYHYQNGNVVNKEAQIFSRCMVEPEYDINIDDLQKEWDNLILRRNLIDHLLAVDFDDKPDEFWTMLGMIEDERGQVFGNLSKFALNVLVIPHSNAQPERAFSKERLTKPYLRNRLGLSALNAVMLINDMLRLRGCDNVCTFQPDQEMINIVEMKTYNYVRDRNNNNNDEVSDDDDQGNAAGLRRIRQLLNLR